MFAELAWVSIAIAVLCALWIALDELRHPQPMRIMNIVWPVTALYFSAFALWAYYAIGRAHSRSNAQNAQMGDRHSMPAPDSPAKSPSAAQVAVGTSHCGAGCMIADVLCEFAIAAAGITLLGSPLFAEYAIDFLAAWALGIVFQYFAIQPMRHLPVKDALFAAIKADSLSILAFQVGMYAWMALVFYRLFPAPHLTPFQSQYWLMMQIGMICGFATSYPMNYFLIRKGLKEAM